MNISSGVTETDSTNMAKCKRYATFENFREIVKKRGIRY